MSASSSLTLERGKACLRCRRRKMRCDGVRPICGQCSKAEIVLDCEYTDSGPTTSQLLERNIADLEARIADILKGPAMSDSVPLKNPYTEKRPSSSKKVERAKSPISLRCLGPSPVAGAPAPMPPMDSFAAPSSLPTPLPYTPHPDSPDFLRSFLAVASHLDFFMHIPRFLNKIKMSIPPATESPIPPALVFSVLLIDSLFGNKPDRESVEHRLLSLAVQNLSTALEPNKIIYMLQAEVLLAKYLLHQNQRVAANYHVSAAVSIAVACNLHKIQSATTLVAPTAAVITLPPPVDAIEVGERIRAFWTVYIMDRGWTVWTHSSSALLDESSVLTQIDTPWPKELHEYEQNQMLSISPSQQTVQNFIRCSATAQQPGQSILSLRVKSSIFFEKAARLSVSHEYGYPIPPSNFAELDIRIQQWSLALPPLSLVPNTRQDIIRGLLTVKTMCCCSTILIQSSLNITMPLNDRVASAALEAVSLLREVDLQALHFVDMVLGILWSIVGKTLIACAGVSGKGWTRHDPNTLMSSLHEVMTALQLFGKSCPLIQREWSRLQSKLAES